MMRIRTLLFVAALAAASVPLTGSACAEENGEHVVKLEEIPAAARQTILKEANGCTHSQSGNRKTGKANTLRGAPQAA